VYCVYTVDFEEMLKTSFKNVTLWLEYMVLHFVTVYQIFVLVSAPSILISFINLAKFIFKVNVVKCVF
jgi:hypothetical protein